MRLKAFVHRCPISQEAGFTLIELLVVMVLALIVFDATLTMMVNAFHAESAVSARTQASGLGSDAIERMTREIRGACSAKIENASGTATSPGGRLDLYTPAGATPTNDCTTPTVHVIYDCTSGACTRTVGTTTTLLTHISNGTGVFTGSGGSGGATNPTFIKITLDQTLGSPFSHPLELQDGVALRNLLSS